jgi:hypothetical protein
MIFKPSEGSRAERQSIYQLLIFQHVYLFGIIMLRFNNKIHRPAERHTGTYEGPSDSLISRLSPRVCAFTVGLETHFK